MYAQLNTKVRLFLGDLIVIFENIGQNSRVFYEANKYSIHAEKDALMKVKNKNILYKCNIYIGKIKNNKLEMATPCDACKFMLMKYRVSKVCNY